MRTPEAGNVHRTCCRSVDGLGLSFISPLSTLKALQVNS